MPLFSLRSPFLVLFWVRYTFDFNPFTCSTALSLPLLAFFFLGVMKKFCAHFYYVKRSMESTIFICAKVMLCCETKGLKIFKSGINSRCQMTLFKFLIQCKFIDVSSVCESFQHLIAKRIRILRENSEILINSLNVLDFCECRFSCCVSCVGVCGFVSQPNSFQKHNL